MELVILTKKWGRDISGATLATQHFANIWKDYFTVIKVFTLYVGEYTAHSKFHVTRCKNNRDLIKKIKQLERANAVFYSDDHLGYLLHKLKIKYVHTYHGNWPDARYIDLSFFIKSFYFIPRYIKTLKYAKNVVSVSNYMVDFVKTYNNNVCVIHNGIDFKETTNTVTKKDFLMVGNVDYRKYGLLLNILRKCKQIGMNYDISIYGSIGDERTAKKLQKFKNIHLMGVVKNVPYREYKCFLNVSSIENLSISVCEAIYNNLNVVCYDVGGLREVVSQYENGFLVKRNDADSFVEKMGYALSINKTADNTFLLQQFDWEKSSMEYLNILKGINN